MTPKRSNRRPTLIGLPTPTPPSASPEDLVSLESEINAYLENVQEDPFDLRRYTPQEVHIPAARRVSSRPPPVPVPVPSPSWSTIALVAIAWFWLLMLTGVFAGWAP